MSHMFSYIYTVLRVLKYRRNPTKVGLRILEEPYKNICVYVYVRIYIYIYMYVCVCMYMYICIHMYIADIYTHVYYMNRFICMYM